MFEIDITNQFKKDLKLLKKRSASDFKTLQTFVKALQSKGFDGIAPKHKPHYLKGNYADCCECHVLNDLLLVWKEDHKNMVITLFRTGTHSDLF